MSTTPMRFLIILGLLTVNGIGGAQLRYYEAGKLEIIDAYMLYVVHGLVNASEGHVPNWAQDFWRTDVTISEWDRPEGDVVTIIHRARHRVAPHTGEPPFGPWFKHGVMFNAMSQVPFVLNFGGGLHGEHIDAQFAYSSAAFAFPDVTSYMHMGVGMHLSDKSDIMDIIRRFGKAAGVLSVPPTKSDAVGLCSLQAGTGGDALVAITVVGIQPADLLQADVRIAAPGELGLPVIDLGPSEMWVPIKNGMIRFLRWTEFPQPLLQPLQKGMLAVNIATWNHPQGEIRGQLQALRGSPPHLGPP